jgi:serine/threonine protein kinase/DNA-binding winged helix-turn-helix (wHTH) protein/tetratricopeptide (TPR) repeat protein
MKEATSARIRFGAFELDLKAGELHKGGHRFRLPEQPFQVLLMLLERPGEVVTREEIQAKLWPNGDVDIDRAIGSAVSRLRSALKDVADKPSYIETLARRGYRFIMPIEMLGSSSTDGGRIPLAVLSAAGQSPLRRLDPGPGKTVSRYRILKLIGGGGMGVVYCAEDLRLPRTVALKFLPEEVASDPVALKRFEREARTASSLNHPNICTIYDVDEHEGTSFIVMEYLEGTTLREFITQVNSGSSADRARKALSIEQVLDMAIQIVDGLDAAHKKQIIHRDIKPANLFVTNQRQVKILDFGLAKLVTAARDAADDLTHDGLDDPQQPDEEAQPNANLTRPGAYLGTLGYMSPEQVMGIELDARTDLFCFGLVLYELCTGKRALAAPNKPAFRHAVLNETPLPAQEINPAIPTALAKVLDQCLEKDRDKRYQHASDVSEDLQQVRRSLSALHRGDISQPPSVVPPQDGKGSKTNLPIPRWGIAAILAIALVVGTYIAYRFLRPPINTRPGSIAVLPFKDLSAAKDQKYFSDGLTDQVISELTHVPGVDVVARSSLVVIKEGDDLRTIGKRLNVANVLEGTVQRDGDRVRITAEMTKAESGYQLWSHTYERHVSDIFALQDEIAQMVARELQFQLTGVNSGGSSIRPTATTSPEAYEAYLQGKFYSRGHAPGDGEKALAYAEQAIQLDPKYAPAWALRSYVLSGLAVSDQINKADGFRKARESAERAIGQDESLADGYLALVRTQVYYDFDLAGAKANLEKVAVLDPGSADLYLARATIANALGQLEQALEFEKRQVELDPLRGYPSQVQTLYFLGRYKDADAALTKSAELIPGSKVHHSRGELLLAQGHGEQALAEFMQEPRELFRLTGEAIANFALGRQRESDDALNNLIATHSNDGTYQIAQVYAFRKQADEAFQWLDRAYQQRDAGILLNIKNDPLLKNLRNDPRYVEMVRKLGLEGSSQ